MKNTWEKENCAAVHKDVISIESTFDFKCSFWHHWSHQTHSKVSRQDLQTEDADDTHQVIKCAISGIWRYRQKPSFYDSRPSSQGHAYWTHQCSWQVWFANELELLCDLVDFTNSRIARNKALSFIHMTFQTRAENMVIEWRHKICVSQCQELAYYTEARQYCSANTHIRQITRESIRWVILTDAFLVQVL